MVKVNGGREVAVGADTGASSGSKYCQYELNMAELSPAETRDGGWVKLVVPLERFGVSDARESVGMHSLPHVTHGTSFISYLW